MRRRKITIFANAGFSFIFNAGYLFALGWCAIKVSMKAMTYGTLTAVLQLIFTDSDTICKYNKNVSTVLCSPCFSRAYYGN